MKKLSWISKLALAAVLAAGALTVPPADAQQVVLCDRFDVLCPDVWDPVICSNGQVYSNGCYAYAACAEDCVPYGDAEL